MEDYHWYVDLLSKCSHLLLGVTDYLVLWNEYETVVSIVTSRIVSIFRPGSPTMFMVHYIFGLLTLWRFEPGRIFVDEMSLV